MGNIVDDSFMARRKIDATDHRILAELSADSRVSVTAIAERLHISRANAYERVNALRAMGVIQGFTAIVDPQKVGLETAAYVFLTLKQDDWETLRTAVANEPRIRHIALVGGQYDAVLLVRTRSVGELRSVIFESIQSLGCVESTQTALIFEDHMEYEYPLPRS